MGRGHRLDSGGVKGLKRNEMETGELTQSMTSKTFN